MKTSCKLLSLAFLFCLSLCARGRVDGWCQQGGQVVVTPTVPNSTTKVQRSYTGCTVNVYAVGTTSPVTLFSDNTGTPLGNPFTASTTTGYYFFYTDSQFVDVNLSGAGISSPFTLGAQPVPDPVNILSDALFTSFSSACSTATSLNVTLLIGRAWTGLTTQTCSANLEIVTGGLIAPAAGQTVSLSSSIIAGNYQIFDTSASGSAIAFAVAPPIQLPDWYGAGIATITNISSPIDIKGGTYPYIDYLIRFFGWAGSSTKDAGAAFYPNINGSSLIDFWDSVSQTGAHYFRLGVNNNNALGNALFGGNGGGIGGAAQQGTRDSRTWQVFTSDLISMMIFPATQHTLLGNFGVSGSYCTSQTVCTDPGETLTLSGDANTSLRIDGNASGTPYIQFSRGKTNGGRIYYNGTDLVFESANGRDDIDCVAAGCAFQGTLTAGGNVTWNGGTETLTSVGAATYNLQYSSGQFGLIQFTRNSVNKGRIFDSSADNLTLEHASGSADLILGAGSTTLANTVITLQTSTLTLPSLPSSAGGGGKYACVDNTGVVYIKSSCP